VPKEAMPVFLSAVSIIELLLAFRVSKPWFTTQVPTESYLSRLEACNFDAFEPKLQTREWKLPYLLWKTYRKQIF
jgi:NADH dehydrogenase [ubiquinone] 1 alpha subcomplex assembly factor 6